MAAFLWIYVPREARVDRNIQRGGAQTERQAGLTSNKRPNLPNFNAPALLMLAVHLSRISFDISQFLSLWSVTILSLHICVYLR